VGVYELRADAALRTQQALIRGYQQLGRAAAIKPPALFGGNVTTEQVKLAQALARTAEAQARVATATNKRIESDARAARALSQTALIDQKRATEAARTAAADDRAAQAALRRGQAEARAAQGGGSGPALPRTFAGFTAGGFAQAAGAFGLATSIPQVVSFSIESGKAALALKETLNGLRAVSGSALVYANAVKTAKEQQILFGGSLQENIEGLQGLVITSRDTGANLQDLVDLSQRLSVKSPEQGAAGSRLALAEAFSEGNITSLSRRFEIPKAKIEALRDASIPAAEKVRVLSAYLDSIGISSEAVAGKVDKTARSYREFAAALEAARLKLGEVAAEQGKGITGQATGALSGVTQLVGAYQQLTQNTGQFGQTVGAILTPLNTYNNALITGWTWLIKNAGAAAEAATATRGLTDIEDIRGQQVRTTTDVTIANVDALSKETKEKLEDQIATAELAREQAQLEKDSALAAQGLLGAGDQATLLAQKYGIAADAAQFLIDKQRGVAAAIGLLIDAQTKATQVLTLPGGVGIGAPGITSGANNSIEAVIDIQKQQAAAEKARIDLLLRTGTPIQIVTQRQKEYNDAVKQFGPNSAEAQTAQGNLNDAQKAAAQASREAINDQIDLAEATGNTAEARRLLNQQLADAKATGNIKEQARILRELEGLDKKTKGGGPTKGLSVLDQDAIQRGETLQAQLDAVNQLLARTNLTEHQRNDLLEKRRKLEEQITNEQEKQRRAALDAQLGSVKDAQARLKEAREAAGLQRALGAGRLSAEQSEAVRLRLAEINLEQQKRALDIQKDQKDAGFAPQQQAVAAQQQATALRNVPAITAPLPIPNLAQLPTVQPSQTVVNLSITIDGKTGAVTQSNVDPNTVLNILQSSVSFRNLSGGA
jgi:hypothetical protein